MKFNLYRRDDLHLVIVPASLQQPSGLAGEGELWGVGRVSLDFNTLSHVLAQAIAIQGYGVADDDDEAYIYAEADRNAEVVGVAGQATAPAATRIGV